MPRPATAAPALPWDAATWPMTGPAWRISASCSGRSPLSEGLHFGSRLELDGKGYLYIALGENNQRSTAQDLGKLQGKIVRIRADELGATDNFVGKAGAPEIWSWPPQSAGHGVEPLVRRAVGKRDGRGGDEVNLIKPGLNYGWPLATYGIDYSGQPIPGGAQTLPGMESPLYWWPKSPPSAAWRSRRVQVSGLASFAFIGAGRA